MSENPHIIFSLWLIWAAFTAPVWGGLLMMYGFHRDFHRRMGRIEKMLQVMIDLASGGKPRE